MLADFFVLWADATRTTIGLFWMAFWAFGLGYLISSMIQVFVTRRRMQETMGVDGPKSVLLGTVFGFISSSCSFAALATTRALFTKGAGLVPSLAFLLASTNLVIELGIVIALFLGWQFVAAEYIGGILLILIMWIVVKVTARKPFIEQARSHARSEFDEQEDASQGDVSTKEAWLRVANTYLMEWAMVWKDVTIGFTIAGIIAVFVPRSFFESLFIGAGSEDPSVLELICQVFVGPIAAFFTFIGSMGNIPLATVLFDNGVSFAGVIAFIFSDLVVFPVLRIQASYYGWKMSLYILLVFLICLASTALLLHSGFAIMGWLPTHAVSSGMAEREFFAWDYTAWANLIFLAMSACCVAWVVKLQKIQWSVGSSVSERILLVVCSLALVWLGFGSILWMTI